MSALKSFVICFATFSKIPMPFLEWKKEDMKYIYCFMPIIGIIMAGLVVFAYWISTMIPIPKLMFGVVAMVLPMAVTGGIHIDGFMDTVDALASHKSPEEKLKILDDPHPGAFAIVYIVFYLFLAVGCLSLISNYREAAAVGIGFVFSRALVSIIAMTEKLAKEGGMLFSFVTNSNRFVTIIISILWLIAAVAVMEMLVPLRSIVTLGLTFIFVLWFQNMNRKQFGGISGDLMGYFIAIVEIITMGVVCVGELLC